MIKALKVTMVLYAILGILVGLAFLLIPRQFTATFGFAAGPAYIASLTAKIGVSYISVCIFLIVAARDPIKHILWVKYAIVFAILLLAAAIYSFALGSITFSQALIDIVIHAVFAAVFIVFYPRGAARIAEKSPS